MQCTKKGEIVSCLNGNVTVIDTYFRFPYQENEVEKTSC